MALLPVIVAPDPRLRRRCAPAGAVDGAVRRLVDDMFETMYDAGGIGLAAPQVGALRRVVVVDTAADGGAPEPLALVDPRVVSASRETAVFEEGCLSLPGHYAEVTRPARARIAYLDRGGAAREVELEGLPATCVQHEIDHLDGVLFVDRISRVRRSMILRKLGKARKAGPGKRAAA